MSCLDLLSDGQLRQLFDKTVIPKQISVIEAYGLLLIRVEKGACRARAHGEFRTGTCPGGGSNGHVSTGRFEQARVHGGSNWHVSTGRIEWARVHREVRTCTCPCEGSNGHVSTGLFERARVLGRFKLARVHGKVRMGSLPRGCSNGHVSWGGSNWHVSTGRFEWALFHAWSNQASNVSYSHPCGFLNSAALYQEQCCKFVFVSCFFTGKDFNFSRVCAFKLTDFEERDTEVRTKEACKHCKIERTKGACAKSTAERNRRMMIAARLPCCNQALQTSYRGHFRTDHVVLSA